MDLLALAVSVSVLATVLVGALAFYSGAAVGARVRGRLEGVLAGPTSGVESPTVTPLRESRSVAGVLRSIVSGAWLARIEADLDRADSNLQVIDFITIRIFLTGLGFAAGFLLLGWPIGFLVGAVAAAVGFQAPQLWLNQRKTSRLKRLEAQLPETLNLIANSLKAGFGLLQALSQAASQAEEPLSSELKVAIHEMNVGSSVEEALLGLSERGGSYDLDLVVTAILIQRSVGGNLSEILETVAGTMRERVRIRGEINTLTAQQRMTGIVIGLLPVGVGIMFMVVSPDYITLLFTEGTGRLLLGVGVILEVVGVFIIRRILAIEV